MERFLLFIRDDGRDQTDVHPSERSARMTLAAYVRSRSEPNADAVPLHDHDAIDNYFATRDAEYVITRLTKTMRREGDRA